MPSYILICLLLILDLTFSIQKEKLSKEFSHFRITSEQRCMPKCLECQKGFNSCTKCSEGSQCCNWACQKCVNQITCTGCKQGYILDQQLNICIFQYSCLSPYCQQCDQQDQCKKCLVGYFLNIQMRTCELCAPKCLNCQNNYECIQCSEGTFWLDGACRNCIENCQKCHNSTGCDKCIDSFFITQNAKCQKCLESCKLCNSKNNCFQCNQKHFWDQQIKQCLQCVQPCLECKNKTQCISCDGNYFYNKTTQKCLECSQIILHCADCDIQNQKNKQFSVLKKIIKNNKSIISADNVVCVKCATRYYLQNSTCEACTQNCLQCNNSSKCITCARSYFVNSQGSCQLCEVYHCLICQTQKQCKICEQGFYWNPSISIYQCTRCSIGCLSCDQFGCFQCQFGFYLKNSNCYKCDLSCLICQNTPTNCQRCLTGYFKPAIGMGQCFKCPQPCTECKNMTSCTNCLPQFYLSKNTCKKCQILGCDQCKTFQENITQLNHLEDTQNCLRCAQGYNLNDNKCYKCIQNCKKCINNSSCIQCSVGYFFNEEITKCLKCFQHCKNCTLIKNTITMCTKCDEGFTLDSSNSKCDPCIENCIQCISSDQTFCLSCKDGFFLKFQNDYACVKCKSPCRLCSSQNECLNCITGYYINAYDQCLKCNEGCEECNEVGCFVCEPKYRLNHNNLGCEKCKISQCLKCQLSEDVCDNCEDGYQYFQPSNLTKATLSSEEPICFRCDETIQGCKTCESPSVCSQCFSGLILEGDNSSCRSSKQTSFIIFYIIIAILSLFVVVLLSIVCLMKYKKKKSKESESKSQTESLIGKGEYSINSEEVVKNSRKQLKSSF